MLQLPAEQAGAPLLVLHGVPQPPQFSVSVLRLTSQPLPGRPSQFANPAAHVNWQLPSEQPVETMFGGAFAVQSYPQEPQSAVLVLRFASQPLPARPSQLSKPASQTWPHVPVEQLG